MSKMFNTVLAVCVGLLLSLIGEQVLATPASTTISTRYEMVTDEVLEERIHNMYSEIDLRLTDDVRKYIYDYTVKHRYSAEDFLGRSSIYFPMFQEKLRDKGIPDEIKCLPIVESNLKPTAVSPYGATGLWQFMSSTGKLYDLQSDIYVDERRDPVKSTEAAAAFLLDLYHKYNDWTLALAAYNCGPGNVNKAMRRSGKSDYWSIRKYLPKETQQYIPKLVAIIYVTQYYYAHDLLPKAVEEDYFNTSSAKVWDGLSFKDIKKISGMSMDMIKRLNPQYIRNYVPKTDGENLLVLPSNKMIDVAYAEQTQLEIINPVVKEEIIEVAEVKPIIVLEEDVSPAMEKIKLPNLERPSMSQLVVVKSAPLQIPGIHQEVAVNATTLQSRKPEFREQTERHVIKRVIR